MYIGLSLNVANEWGQFIAQIFKGINLSRYEWEIITDDIIYKDTQAHGLFSKNIVSSKVFEAAISKPEYYTIFADFKAYPIGSERTNFNSFDGFMNSNCEIHFICYDVEFIEIYCKQSKLLDMLYSNCKKVAVGSVAYVSEGIASNQKLFAF